MKCVILAVENLAAEAESIFPDGCTLPGIRDIAEALCWFISLGIVFFIYVFLQRGALAKYLNKLTNDKVAKLKKIEPDILPKVKGWADLCISDTSNLLELLKANNVLFLTGSSGSGKTTILAYIAKRMVEDKSFARDVRKKLNFSKMAVLLIDDKNLRKIDAESTGNDGSCFSILEYIDSCFKSDCPTDRISSAFVNQMRKTFISNKDPNERTWENYQLTHTKAAKNESKAKARKVNNKKISAKTREKKCKLGLYILLDNYNEIPEKYRADIITELKTISSLGGCVRVIVSSHKKPPQGNFTCAEVCDLEEKTIKEYISNTEKRTEKNKPEIPDETLKLINSPILLTMYANTFEIPSNLQIINEDEYPLEHKEIRMISDIYWNYLCSVLGDTLDRADKLNKTLKAIYIMFVLPYVAMRLENQKEPFFDFNTFKTYVQEFSKNLNIFQLRTHIGPSLLWESQEQWGLLVAEADNVLQNFVEYDVFLQKYGGNTSVNGIRRYEFQHELIRDFFAAVYRFQRDMYMLDENLGIVDQSECYWYSDSEKIPDINVRVRKFYYQLVAQRFRAMDKKTRVDLLKKSVRYNCLVSDLYFYGDAALRKTKDGLGFAQNDVKALQSARRAIEIGENRINDYCGNENRKNLDEVNRVTDLTLLCWIRWSATDIIQNRIKSDDPQKAKKLHTEAYTYSEHNTKCGKYGEILGYDKLAQMMFHKDYLSKEEIIWEIRRETRWGIDSEKNRKKLVFRYLEIGKNGGYHYSFSKHASFLEAEIKNGNIAENEIDKTIREIYANYKKALDHKPTDFFAISRLLFYNVCYQKEIEQYKGGNISFPGDIGIFHERLVDLEAICSPKEIYGYEHFCENAGFWYLMQIFRTGKKDMNLDDFTACISSIQTGKTHCSRDQLDVENAKMAIVLYKKLYDVSPNVSPDSVDNARLKALIAHRFVCTLFGDEFNQSEQLCDPDKYKKLKKNADNNFKTSKKNYFKEERYAQLLRCTNYLESR